MTDDIKKRLKHIEEPKPNERDLIPSEQSEEEIRRRHEEEKKKEEQAQHSPAQTVHSRQPRSRLDEKTDKEQRGVIDVLKSERTDNELNQLVAEHAYLKPYEAILDVTKKEVDEHADDSKTNTDHDKTETKEKKSDFWQRDQTSAKLPTHEERSNIPCDNEEFACVLPLPVANKLAEFDRVEPETMIFLQEKFGDLQKRLPEQELLELTESQPVNSLEKAADHAKEQMRPLHQDPAREQRAREQITIILEEIEHTHYLPRYQAYILVLSRCDCRDGAFYVMSERVIAYDKVVDYRQKVERITRDPERPNEERSEIEYDDFDR